MKKIWLMLCCAVLAMSLAGCTGHELSALGEPPSDLEFWLTECVDDVDLSKYQEKYGMMGGHEYYGTGYLPTIGEDGQQIDPQYFVVYTVTRYPDYSSKRRCVTSICITDPAIEVYGLTVNSTEEEIRRQMEERGGFAVEKMPGGALIARRGNYTFAFSQECIRISVKVTNKHGITF